MPLRVALFLLAFGRLEPSRCRAPCSAPQNGFSLISQEKKQMPLRVALFSSCFWQTRTPALPRSMFGSAERVLVDIARKKQMPLRVACFFFLRYHYTTFFWVDTSEKTLRYVRKMNVAKVEIICYNVGRQEILGHST